MSNPSAVKFVSELPPKRTCEFRVLTPEIVGVLMRRPDEWAVIREFPAAGRAITYAKSIRGYAPPGVEVEGRGRRLYARWVGVRPPDFEEAAYAGWERETP